VPILLLLLAAMAIEITVLVAVGQAIGLLPTILMLILISLLGVWMLRREGSRALVAFQQAVLTRRPPHREVADGVLIAAAGVLVLIPGFVSDVLALALLFPPTRAIISRRLTRASADSKPVEVFVVDSVVVDDEPGTAPRRKVLPPG
jgi:UPF0716 protein FxsA